MTLADMTHDSPSLPKRGRLLLAHGARDPRWVQPFERIIELASATQPEVPHQLSFLEFMTPGLVEGGRLLAAQGCTEIDVVPMFLGVGGHVRKDVPVLLEQMQQALPGVRITLLPAIGERDEVLQAMAASLASAG